MKKNLLIAMSMVLALTLATGCGCTKTKKDEKEEVKVNTEKEVIKDQTVDGLELTNTSLVTTDGISKLTTLVSNNTSSDYELNEFTIIIKDANGEEIVRIPGYVGSTIKAGESKTINSSVDIDLSKAKSVEYEVVK